MDEVYGVLDAKELPRFEDSVNHKVYVYVLCYLCVCSVVLLCGLDQLNTQWFAVYD
jgi:hypothetical protein